MDMDIDRLWTTMEWSLIHLRGRGKYQVYMPYDDLHLGCRDR